MDAGYVPLIAKYLPKMDRVALMVDHGKGWESHMTFTIEQALDFGPKLYNLAKTANDQKRANEQAANHAS